MGLKGIDQLPGQLFVATGGFLVPDTGQSSLEQQSSTGPGKQDSFLENLGKNLQLLEGMEPTRVTGGGGHGARLVQGSLGLFIHR